MTRIQTVTTFALTFLLLLVAAPVAPSACAQDQSATGASDATATATEAEEAALETPWDYDPYRVLIWIASDDPSIRAETTHESLRKYLDRDFAALWRFDIAYAPAAVRSSAMRQIDKMSFDVVLAK